MGSIDPTTPLAIGELPDEASIRQGWQDDEPVMVSMVCISYNHEPFVELALQGMLRQRLSHPFEILCYDDASEDSTRDVIRRYAQRYPGLIRTLFPESNQYRQGRRPFAELALPECRGRYIAHCEGDDLWLDCNKVQIQVDYLERHPDVAVTTHDIGSMDEQGHLISASHLAPFYKRHFSAEEVRQAWAGPTAQAMVFRNCLSSLPPEFFRAFHGDVFLAALLGEHGASHYLPEIQPALYRQHAGGVFSPLTSADKLDGHELTFYWMYRYYKRLGRLRDARVMRLKALEKSLRTVTIGDLWRLLRARLFGHNPKRLFASGGPRHGSE